MIGEEPGFAGAVQVTSTWPDTVEVTVTPVGAPGGVPALANTSTHAPLIRTLMGIGQLPDGMTQTAMSVESAVVESGVAAPKIEPSGPSAV